VIKINAVAKKTLIFATAGLASDDDYRCESTLPFIMNWRIFHYSFNFFN